MKKKPELDRFLERIEPAGDCWRWTGPLNHGDHGYGTLSRLDRSAVYAHRWSYEYHVAPIPDGLTIDHLCRNTWCVNPWHLEPVPMVVNLHRKYGATDRCVNGHDYTPENTYGRPLRNGRPGRGCRTCRAESDRRRHERRMAARASWVDPDLKASA